MRFAAYASASTALAVGVVLHAFNQRPNFFSATVYLAHSQACRLILLNLFLFSAYGLVRGLQKLLYGPLRAIEREQLWDRSWFAVSETLLAMTTFRGDVGVYFSIMFACLLAGKVWTWISESRVETLEQQPPANPRLFHSRLVASLLISEVFDVVMLRYCISVLLDQPRPGMMIMFAFEFAVLFISSSSTTMRYVLALQESIIVKQQTKARIDERRDRIRLARLEAERVGSSEASALPREEDIDETDVDVPGWQEKGRWILFLDLLTDFLKLIVYMLFFSMLLLFHGIPIHIVRDVYLTTKSFLKRIADFQKYRSATKDMNQRYPDATAQELERDGTCIICREDMRPWQEEPVDRDVQRGPHLAPDERQRPKRLPCGHVLHLGCLRSWLERQQACPTCRTSVLAPRQSATQSPAVPDNVPPIDGARPRGNEHHRPHARAPADEAEVQARAFNLGPWRFTLAAGNAARVRETMQRLQGQNGAELAQAATENQNRTTSAGVPEVASRNVSEQLNVIETQITQEISRLGRSHAQLYMVRYLQAELERLRGSQHDQTSPIAQSSLALSNPTLVPFSGLHGLAATQPAQMAHYQVFGQNNRTHTLGPDHPDLPHGMTLPEGWSLLPLERIGAAPQLSGSSQERRSQDSRASSLQPEMPNLSRQSSYRNGPPPASGANLSQSRNLDSNPRNRQAFRMNDGTYTSPALESSPGLPSGLTGPAEAPDVPNWSQRQMEPVIPSENGDAGRVGINGASTSTGNSEGTIRPPEGRAKAPLPTVEDTGDDNS